MIASFADGSVQQTETPMEQSTTAVKQNSNGPTDMTKASEDDMSDPEVLALKDAWKSLPLRERGKRLKYLAARYSLRHLARTLCCSEARIRQLVDLADLPLDAEKASREGRIGVKRALKLVRQLRAEQHRRLIATDVTTRQNLVESGACLMTNWLLRLFVETYALQFLSIVSGEEYGPAGRVFLKLKPKPHTLHLTVDEARVIRRWKPKYAKPDYGPDLLNYAIEWWAGWAPRAMPDPQVRSAAIALAKNRLYSRIYRGRLAG